ncbi:MAG: LemA family protein [Bdellovibrionales bacterium]|nr:LemA family protein [Bdellovibrionales bacterium]
MSVEWLVLLGGVTVIFVVMYNSLVAKKNEIENAVGAVHSYLQKRADLIPSLVATVKQYAQHEMKLLNDLTAARTAIQRKLSDDGELQKADSQMSQMFGQVFAVAENYPELKASENFLNLQGSLNEIEGQLSAARRTYNSAVVRYNNAVESIPTVFLAQALGYRRKAVFQVEPANAQRPDITKLFGETGS